MEDRPIIYKLLPGDMFSASRVKRKPKGHAQARAGNARVLDWGRADEMRLLQGIAGWLVTEPEFLKGCQTLEGQWATLPDSCRPRFPIRYEHIRSQSVEEAVGGADHGAHAAFVSAFLKSCECWSLTGMQTWDLPEPQGLCFPGARPHDVNNSPYHGVHVVVPVYFRIQGSSKLVRLIRARQEAVAHEKGIDASAVGLTHAVAYGRILQISHIEHTVISRYGPAKQSAGSIDSLCKGIAASLNLGHLQVKKWHYAILRCRRGCRGSVRAFWTRG
jgi:hypothetical protein